MKTSLAMKYDHDLHRGIHPETRARRKPLLHLTRCSIGKYPTCSEVHQIKYFKANHGDTGKASCYLSGKDVSRSFLHYFARRSHSQHNCLHAYTSTATNLSRKPPLTALQFISCGAGLTAGGSYITVLFKLYLRCT